MLLPMMSTAREALGSTLLGRLLGPSSSSNEGRNGDKSTESLPPLKFKIGQEPNTPRTGSPGFQDGHWVIARPKLATPSIYQHSRGRANEDRSPGGLGRTTRSTTTSESFRPSSTRGSTRATTPWSRGDGWQDGGYTGDVHAWDEEDHGDEEAVQARQDYLEENQGDEEAQQQQPRFFDNPALDQAQLHLDTIYFATARPRFEANPACLRRQRDNASAAAGALSNSLGGNDSWTNQQSRPTDTVGEERAEALRLGTSLLIRSLETEFPSPMRIRAAAALQKALTFRDVREGVADVIPSAVAPLVEILKRNALTKGAEESPGEHEQDVGVPRHETISQRGLGPESDGLTEPFKQESKAALNAAACLRVLALSEGLPETMLSASVIPVLVDGLNSESALMRSVCGGCLASMAPCDEEACLEMLDFGIMSPLLQMVRSKSPLLEVTAWGVLAAITRAHEVRRLFVGARGLEDVEGVLVRKQKRAGSNRALLVCQEKAMQVLLRMCSDDEGREDSVNNNAPGDSVTQRAAQRVTQGRELTGGEALLTASSLSAHDIISGKKELDSSLGQAAGAEASENQRGVSPLPPTHFAEGFVSNEAVFRGILRQMRVGTPTSTAAAAEVVQRTWKACSRRQVDATIPLVLDLLKSDFWMLKSAAAQVILHVYVEDEQRLRCARSGGVEALVGMVRTKAQQLQAGALAALLSLCQHPDVPTLVVEAGGLAVLTEYMTTARDVATRYVVLTLMKVILVCERPALEPFLPDMLVTEHVLGASDEVEAFVKVFVQRRKATDYLGVGIKNLRRFQPSDIESYKCDFKKLDKDASGELDEAELTQLLKQLKVDYRKKNVRRIIAAVDRNCNGIVEFDEFLDIMWDTKHAPGPDRGALLKSMDVFTRGALASAQATMKRQANNFKVKTSATLKRSRNDVSEAISAPHASAAGSPASPAVADNTQATLSPRTPSV